MSVPKRYPSDEADKFMLRLPPGLRDRIAEVAQAGHRSMNSELVMRIQASLQHAPVLEREPAIAPGTIRDPGGIDDAGTLAAIPTLAYWAMLLLAGLLGAVGLRRSRRA